MNEYFLKLLRRAVIPVVLMGLTACATLSDRDPLQVTVAGIESLPGEGMEMRLLVKLRVQNPNERRSTTTASPLAWTCRARRLRAA